MDDRDCRLYFNLMRPSPFVREANGVAVFYLAYTVVAGGVISYAASSSLIRSKFIRESLVDAVVLDALLLAVWFAFVLVLSVSRIHRYRQAATNVPRKAYFLSYPWAAASFISFAVSVLLAVQRAGLGNYYVTILAVLIPFLVGMSSRTVQNWFREFSPQTFMALSPAAWAVTLGPSMNLPADQFVRGVLDFRRLSIRQLSKDAADTRQEEARMSYIRHDTLATFQRTLSCRYETSQFVGSLIDRSDSFGGEWVLLDIGGGDGIFTSEMLKCIRKRPREIVCIDAIQDNVFAYSELLRANYPATILQTYVGKAEDAIEKLPRANLVLASHSLYSILDWDREPAERFLRTFVSKIAGGFGIVIMASKRSQAYEIKRRVLRRLSVVDRSSFGEDLLGVLNTMFSGRFSISLHVRDSFMNVSELLTDDRALISWIAYFCRVDPTDLAGDVPFVRETLRGTAIPYDSLPDTLRLQLDGSGVANRAGLNARSSILLHKECIIVVEPTQVRPL